MHSTTTTTIDRPRWRIGRVLLATALAACALPAGASAATLEIGRGDLIYRGGSERNSLSVREDAGGLVVSDPAGVSNIFIPLTDPRPRCVRIDNRTMRCPLRAEGFTVKRLVAQMGDGDDTAGSISTQLPVLIEGGSGFDTYDAGNPPFLTNVEFRGGSGVDTASYAGSGQGPGGRGVRISNDGVANDGRPGLDTDTIGRDVESLTGSRFADEITANAGDDCCGGVRGGPGDDVLRAGSGSAREVAFLMEPVADGADKIIGGPLPSRVSYAQRTRPVNATLNFGGADDGEAGERDEIIGGHEVVAGGQAGDTIRAPFGSTAPHRLFGEGGNDTIDGADGADKLFGGAGGDAIRAFGGNDQVFAKDGETDAVDCGLETDAFEVDSIDNFGNCENRTVGVLRLEPKTLRVRAGESARLKLSWRHPRSWRQLRRVTLRLYRGNIRVGEVAVAPRTRRIHDRGAVKVLRGSRIAHKGKTVSARLALRLDRSLASRRLRVEVEAVDVRGVRQRERQAGSIRVSR